MPTYLKGATLALLTLAPALAVAQDQDKKPAPPPAAGQYRMQVAPGQPMAVYMNRMGGARLGLALDANADASVNKQGALVNDVLDDSPADEAGIKKGDIITRFNGTALGGDDPSGALVKLARKLEPGDSVRLDYTRDGARKSATLVARELGAMQFREMLPAMERLRAEMPRMLYQGPDSDMRTWTVFGGPMMGLDLVEMNSGLGEYFGTSDGLLVTRTPGDSTMPLRAGDVILGIGGRTPQNEGHAMRILGSYAPGEVVKFDIMRKKSRQSVSWTVPERHGVMLRQGQPARWSGTIEKREKS